jgi:hydroxyacylglutathione hydrolase
MYFERVKTPGLGHNAYVLGCGEGLAVVIDPRRDVEKYLCLAREEGLSIAYVLETHRQEDFEFGSRALAEATGAEIVGGCHPLFGEIDVKLEDGQELKVGKTRFVALATPGHTPESMSYAVYAEDSGEKCWGVFTGDALFVGDTGRTDLTDPDRTGENAGILYDAIHRKIGPLGDQALLFRRTAPVRHAAPTYPSAMIPRLESSVRRTTSSPRAEANSSPPRKRCTWRALPTSGTWRK